MPVILFNYATKWSPGSRWVCFLRKIKTHDTINITYTLAYTQPSKNYILCPILSLSHNIAKQYQVAKEYQLTL